MSRTSVKLVLTLLCAIVAVAFARINTDQQGTLTAGASSKIGVEDFFKKIMPLISTPDGKCELLKGKSETDIYETLFSALPIPAENPAETTKDTADTEANTLPGNVLVVDDEINGDACNSIQSDEAIAVAAQLEEIFGCLSKLTTRQELKDAMTAFVVAIKDGKFNKKECEDIGKLTTFMELESNVVNRHHQKMWNVFSNLPAVGVYALGMIINVFRPWDETMPAYAAPRDPANLAGVKVTAVEFHPSKTGNFKTRISDNIKELVAGTPAGENKHIAVWPEYGIVNDAYFDVTRRSDDGKVTLMWNALIMYLGGGSLPYGGFKSWRNGQAKPNCDDATYTLEHIVCGAIKKRTFLVANILMKSPKWSITNFLTKRLSVKLYNVNVVFNPDGDLLQIYEKMFPVPGEAIYALHAPNNPDRQLVNIGNVPFGLMVCYDALFPTAGYYRKDFNNVLFPTEWTSNRDLLSFLLQQAFSRATQTNFIAANINFNNPQETGSGIFVAGKPVGAVAVNNAERPWPGGFANAGFFYGGLAEKGYATISSTDVVLTARPDKYFDDDVVLKTDNAPRAEIPIEGKANLGRVTIEVCAGNTCGAADYQPLDNNAQFTADQAKKELRLEQGVNKVITLKKGNHICKFTIKLMNAANDRFILQAENGYTLAEKPITRVLKSSLAGIKNRKVLNCLIMRVPEFKVKSWSKYETAKDANSKLEVTIEANNFGQNTVVLPITGLANGGELPSVEPFTKADSRSSTWKQGGTAPVTILTVKQTADDNKFFYLASLYGVQKN